MTLSRTITILLAPAIFLLTGCTTNRALTMPQSTPEDFVLALTVFAPANEHPESRSQVPARYILESDATLRVAIGPGSDANTYPRRARVLDADQIQSLWASARALDLTNEDTEGIRMVASPEIFRAPSGQTLYLLEIRSQHTQRAFTLDPANPSARALVEQLAELAWVQAD